MDRYGWSKVIEIRFKKKINGKGVRGIGIIKLHFYPIYLKCKCKTWGNSQK